MSNQPPTPDDPYTVTRHVLNRICGLYPATQTARSKLKETIVSMALLQKISDEQAVALIERWGLRHD